MRRVSDPSKNNLLDNPTESKTIMFPVITDMNIESKILISTNNDVISIEPAFVTKDSSLTLNWLALLTVKSII
jgi:hypothetical protein